MTSTRELLTAALAHWAAHETCAGCVAYSEADYEAFERAVPLIAGALKRANELIDEWDHPLNPMGGIDPTPEINQLRTALAALEATDAPVQD